jgi:hypothetical protein
MAKNKSASGATKETCSNYHCDQFYLFIFFMTKLLIIEDLGANRVRFFVPILSAHFIALLYWFIAHSQRRDIRSEIPSPATFF